MRLMSSVTTDFRPSTWLLGLFELHPRTFSEGHVIQTEPVGFSRLAYCCPSNEDEWSQGSHHRVCYHLASYLFKLLFLLLEGLGASFTFLSCFAQTHSTLSSDVAQNPALIAPFSVLHSQGLRLH